MRNDGGMVEKDKMGGQYGKIHLEINGGCKDSAREEFPDQRQIARNALELALTWKIGEDFPRPKLPSAFILEPEKCSCCGFSHKDFDGGSGADKCRVHCSATS